MTTVAEQTLSTVQSAAASGNEFKIMADQLHDLIDQFLLRSSTGVGTAVQVARTPTNESSDDSIELF